jgi:hypothetical protein
MGRNMTQNQLTIWSTERRLARLIVFSIIAVPMIAIVLRDLGGVPLTQWVLCALIVAPMFAMVSHRDLGVDPLVRWFLYAFIGVPMIGVLADLVWSFIADIEQ